MRFMRMCAVFVGVLVCLTVCRADEPGELPWVSYGPPAEVEEARWRVDVARHVSEIFLLSSDMRVIVLDDKARVLKKEALTAPGGKMPTNLHLDGFAVSPAGDWIAVAENVRVTLFEDFEYQRAVELNRPFALPGELTFLDDGPTLLVSRQFIAPLSMYPSLDDQPPTVATIDGEGEVEDFALPLTEGPADIRKRSLADQVRLAVTDDGEIWVGDWAGYRLRKLDGDGSVIEEVEDPRRAVPVKDEEFDGEALGVGESVSGEAERPRGISMSLATVIRDIAADGTYVWVLANRGEDGGNGQQLDVVDPADGTVARFPFPESKPPLASVTLTDRYVVLGRSREGAPLLLDRHALELTVIDRRQRGLLEQLRPETGEQQKANRAVGESSGSPSDTE